MTPRPSSVPGRVVVQVAPPTLPQRHDTYRKVDVVLLETVQPRPRVGWKYSPSTRACEALCRSPLGQLGVIALARDHQRGQHRHALPTQLAQICARNGVAVCGLISISHSGQYCVPSLRTAAGESDRSRSAWRRCSCGRRGSCAARWRRLAVSRVWHRRRGARGLHELSRVGVERLEIAALTLGEQDVEGDRALAAAAHTRDHREASAGSESMSLRLCSRACRIGSCHWLARCDGVASTRRAGAAAWPSAGPQGAPVWLRLQRAIASGGPA